MIHLNPVASAGSAIVFFLLLRTLLKHFKPSKALTNVPLRGPSRKSIIFGVTRFIRLSRNPKAVYEAWAKQYGAIYRIPLAFGSEAVVVSDLKAVAHIFAKDTFGYVKTPGLRVVIERVVGRGVLWVEGDDHRRQRKTLNPAFSPGTIKNMTPLFYDTTYRLKSEWDKLLDSSTAASKVEIEMHEWMMKLTLDIVGRAIFGYDFHTLEGKYSTVEEALRVFNTTTPSKLGMLTYAASIFVPWVGNLPTERNKLFKNLSDSARQILEGLLQEKEGSDRAEKGQKSEKSLIELLIDAETNGSGLQTPERKEEIVTQMKTILIAGSDTPGLIIVWALIELARHPEIQSRLRIDINSSPGAELDWNHLQSSCPFLDAVISEVLRLRPSIGETPRVANEDDILQLKEPITDASGQLVDRIHIPKGTKIIIPNHFLNSSPAIWGPDATVFNPDRWMADPLLKSGDHIGNDTSSGRGRLWTFGEGPRVCVGKAFALTQLKIVLAILLRDLKFELPQGPETPIDIHYSLLARPKIKNLDGAKIPLFVSRVR